MPVVGSCVSLSVPTVLLVTDDVNVTSKAGSHTSVEAGS